MHLTRRLTRRLPLALGIIGVLALLGLLVLYESACAGPWGLCGLDGLPLGRVTQQYMLSRAEAHLFYPGSMVLQSNSAGQGPDGGLLRPQPAFAQASLETTATSTQIMAWYRQRLEDRGWQLAQRDSITMQFLQGDRQNFDVQVFGKQAPAGIAYDGRGNVYDMYFQVRAP